MISIFQTVISFINAINALKSLVDSFVSFYISMQIDQMKEENRLAIRKAIDEQDQRDIEKALNSPRAGLPSGNAGAVIVSDLPGVTNGK